MTLDDEEELLLSLRTCVAVMKQADIPTTERCFAATRYARETARARSRKLINNFDAFSTRVGEDVETVLLPLAVNHKEDGPLRAVCTQAAGQAIYEIAAYLGQMKLLSEAASSGLDSPESSSLSKLFSNTSPMAQYLRETIESFGQDYIEPCLTQLMNLAEDKENLPVIREKALERSAELLLVATSIGYEIDRTSYQSRVNAIYGSAPANTIALAVLNFTNRIN